MCYNNGIEDDLFIILAVALEDPLSAVRSLSSLSHKQRISTKLDNGQRHTKEAWTETEMKWNLKTEIVHLQSVCIVSTFQLVGCLPGFLTILLLSA